MPNEPKSPAQEALERIETEIDAGRIFLRRSVANVPYIIFQADVAGNELLELRGRCAKEMLTDFIWRQTKRLLKKSDLESVTTALCGRAASCPRGGIPDPELMRLIDSEPILAVVWEWTAAEAALRSAYPLVVESSMSELCKTLRDFAKKREL